MDTPMPGHKAFPVVGCGTYVHLVQKEGIGPNVDEYSYSLSDEEDNVSGASAPTLKKLSKSKKSPEPTRLRRGTQVVAKSGRENSWRWIETTYEGGRRETYVEDGDRLHVIIMEKINAAEDVQSITRLIRQAREDTQVAVLRSVLTDTSIDMGIQQEIIKCMLYDPEKTGINQGVLFFLLVEGDSFNCSNAFEVMQDNKKVLAIMKNWEKCAKKSPYPGRKKRAKKG